MLKTANERVHAEIRRARAVIAAGVRLKKPELEKEGRQDFAEASIKNQILLYGPVLTDAARNRLQRELFDTDPSSEDATADAEETTAELLADLRSARSPLDLTPVASRSEDEQYDPDDEFEDESDL